MDRRQKQLVALVLGSVLGLASATYAGARIVSTQAGCNVTFKRTSTLFNACMSCVKARGNFKLGKNNSWGCK